LGSIEVQVADTPLLYETLSALAVPAGHGGHLLFTGRVRDSNVGKSVVGITYDAFVPLAEKVLYDIARTTESTDVTSVIKIFHRIGFLGIGDISVAVWVSTVHRQEVYAISREIIEQLKIKVPIWKKEHYVDGESRWLAGHALCAPGVSNLKEEKGFRSHV
jgi:molybdopterin synthase catalytic subunit